jgi:hypothetical protein
MPKAALLMTVLLLSAVWVVAQTAGTASGTATPSSSPTSPGQSQTTPPTPATGAAGAQAGTTTQSTTGPSQTIEGCLSGTPGQYSLITKSGQVYSLSGDDSLLGNHVGQVVKATGAESSGSATPAASGNAASGGTAYGSTGTTGSQPGAATQSQTATPPGQANTGVAAPGQAQPAAPAASSGPRFQVSNLTKVSSGCKMAEPH